MDVGDLAGAIWLPDDGQANPADLTVRAGPRAPGGAASRSASGPGSPAS